MELAKYLPDPVAFVVGGKHNVDRILICHSALHQGALELPELLGTKCRLAPFNGGLEAVDNAGCRTPTQDCFGFRDVCRPAEHADRFVELAIDVGRCPIHYLEDRIDEFSD